ncbi:MULTISPECIES: pentapeptide repeat-containing protein [unclassified Phaeobacter]|uniref:pentapeptide repeat-containing protein n=1 Tax=unclassified Phaeobacter TaxID=2621772 RepID=UPI003A89EA73
MTTIILPIDPKYFWAIVALAGFVLAVAVVYAAMPRTEGKQTDPLDRLKDILGLAQFGDGLFLLLALMWSGLFLALFTGLLLMLWELIWFVVPQNPLAEASARFALLRLAAMTATLGAVVALPFTLIRIRLTREANKTADESLFNDKINAATEDLHAMRQRWDEEQKQNIWEDDITRRNAAIDRLEGLVKERPDTAPRVSRLLSVYVRELSREVPAEIPPEEPTPNELHRWLFGLTVKRSDMENAVQVLGRMKRIRAVNCVSISIDLRHANLQRFDLTGLDLSGAILSGSHMQGSFLRDTQLRNASLPFAKMQGTNLGNAKMLMADLSWADLRQAFLGCAMLRGASLRHADMQGAEIYDAELQKADLTSTNMRGANLSRAKMQGIRLGGANMQGADISATTIDGASGLNRADLSGSLLSQVDFSRTNIGLEQLNSGFGTTDTILPNGNGPDSSDWPAHWPKLAMGHGQTFRQWKKWQTDPDNYIPPTAPDE